METKVNDIQIRAAQRDDAAAIATYIMEAMSEDCCRFFYGAGHTAQEFHDFLESLVMQEHTQYSYLNTIVATDHQQVVGVAVSYDGAMLHTLREPFFKGMRTLFGRDVTHIGDETQAGELYLDSFAVLKEYRRRGIGSRLIRATFEKSHQLDIPCVGLLVDCGNPKAEQLYLSLGFEKIYNSSWGGHDMHHLQKRVDPSAIG